MNIYILVLRLVHIFSAVLWAGGTITMAGFIEPTARAAGQEGSRFMQRLGAGLYSPVMTIAGPLTVLAGLLLYWNDSVGFRQEWILSGPGLGFTVGALFGIGALSVGLFVTRPAVVGLGAMGKEIQMAGKPPTPEQLAKLAGLSEKLTSATVQTAILVSIALAAMALARYL